MQTQKGDLLQAHRIASADYKAGIENLDGFWHKRKETEATQAKS